MPTEFFLTMTMTAHLLRPCSVSMSTTMEITFDHSFCIGLLLLRSQGGASSLEVSPDSIDRLNQYTKLRPFFSASSFDHNFRPNNNQTFIVYVKSTLLSYRRGLCGFCAVPKFPCIGTSSRVSNVSRLPLQCLRVLFESLLPKDISHFH